MPIYSKVSSTHEKQFFDIIAAFKRDSVPKIEFIGLTEKK